MGDRAVTVDHDVVALCRELAERFAPRAAAYDREGNFPVENFEELKAAGLLGIMVPKQYGGMGMGFLTYTMALEQLAKGDASTALTFNMHNITAGTLAEVDPSKVEGRHGKRMADFREWVFDQMINGKKVFASANSEPGIGAHFSAIQSTYRRVDGGFVINGAKLFVSMAGYADFYTVVARRADSTADVPELSFFIVGLDNPGVRIEKVWDALGMRATTSDNMYFTDCFVPEDRLFLGIEGLGAYKVVREPHWVIGGYVGAYLGICTATFEYMVEHLQKKKIPGTVRSVVERDWVQHEVGRLYAGLQATRHTVYHGAELVETQPGTRETNVAVHCSKYAVSEYAPYLASQAIRLCGGSSISRSRPLERLYRDARCGGLMPATSDECLLYVGKSELGLELDRLADTYW
jgi:alkylation response protein AidB-like acyl-CoA dehydrogenase